MSKQETITAGVDRWTPERVETLKKLYLDDLSASAIAAQLGEGFTRNAVLGKIHRLKLPAGQTPRPPRTPKAKVARVPRATPKKPIATVRPSNDGKGLAFKMTMARAAGLSLEDGMSAVLGREHVAGLGDAPDGRPLLRLTQLTEHTCKWPFGDPREPGFGFCGAHSLEKSPYCGVHARQARSLVPTR